MWRPFWSFPIIQRRTKSTRKRNTPENAGNRPFPESAFSGALCVFGCSLFPSKRAPKSTRKRNTPENADSGNGWLPALSGVLRFRVLFGACQLIKGVYMGKMGSICHFARALPVRIWQHCSQVLLFVASIWCAEEGV